MRRTAQVLLTASTAAAGATWAYMQPTYTSCPSKHETITSEHCALMRKVGDGTPVKPSTNPGARLFQNVLNHTELKELLQELQPIKANFGISLIEPVHAAIYRWQMSYLSRPPPVNMLRVTGRPEHAAQRRPWGYGDDLDEAALPPAIRAAADRLRQLPGLRLGRLRDVTINYRHSGFLRLDPHLDPAGDGENVFVVSVDAPSVLTLSPVNWYHLTRLLGWLGADEREQVRRESERTSWTCHDIDVLVPPGAALHLSADARWKWMHGTRLGVAPGGPGGPGGAGEGRAQASAEVNRLAGYGAAGLEPVEAAPGAGAVAGAGAAAGAAAPASSRGWFSHSVVRPAPAQSGKAAGVAVPVPAAAPPLTPGGGLLHWFGRPEELFGPTLERHSVVFAFAAPDD